MKGFPTLIILSALLALASCGKENESGRNNNGACLSYVGTQCNAYAALPGGINYGLSSNANLSSIVQQIPCTYGMMNRATQVVNVVTNTIMTAGHSYIGITSYGDIAIVVGNGSTNSQATLYICGGNIQVPNIAYPALGEYATPRCPIKTITNMDLGSRIFRDPRGGLMTGQGQVPLSFCTY